MCGITGYYTQNGFFNSTDLKEMTTALAHRGPDADGFFLEGPAGIGHRRLSIIDLSAVANQPMTSGSGRYVMVFNGEVYNFQELKQELKVEWKTHSDTEVILEAFAAWGADFVKRLNGMFTIVIYDKEEEVLWLFRDRVGIKPLFYYWDGSSLAFASELKALLKVPAIEAKKSIDKAALNTYLYLGYVPEPMSIYKEIRKFPSAHYAKLSARGMEVKAYWSFDEHVKADTITNEQEAKERLNELVTSSVKYRLISDVPFGTFLSGGIDSSLVTAVAQKVSSQPINTFSIGFKESSFNEAEYARAVANHLGTKHHEFMVSYSDAIALFDDILSVYDEPFADSSSVPTMLVSRLARQHVTMTLSGDGGDETYMGYGAYRWAERLQNPLLKGLRGPLAGILSMMPSRYARVAHLLQYDDPKRIKSHIFSQEQYYFTEAELKQLLKPDLRADIQLDETTPDFSRKLTATEEQALFDMKYYLKDDLLVKVDRASMRYSLEARVPLLDHRLIEFALNVSPELKMRGKTLKYLLKQLLYDYVPQHYFDRPKWGFAMPINRWLRGELRYLIDDYLSESAVNKAGMVDYRVVKLLITQYLAGKDYLYNRLWQLIILHKWHSAHF